VSDTEKSPEAPAQTTAESAPAKDPQRSKKLILVGALVLIGALVAVILISRSGGGDDSSGSISTDLSTKPEIEAPGGDPPAELESNDIVVGDGATAESGDTVDVQYVGIDYSTGAEFDASWGDDGKPGDPPFSFQLGGGQVIPGWDQGVEGMKVGGRRELIIPPDLAYGAQGSPPAIGPNATLVFVVDLVDVQPGGPTAQPTG
jgi:peptidylprolyl isomerase